MERMGPQKSGVTNANEIALREDADVRRGYTESN